MERIMNFEEKLKGLINEYCKENDSSTPDFILANYLKGCLNLYNDTIQARDKWWNIEFDDSMGVKITK
jgi:hypothetical protein